MNLQATEAQLEYIHSLIDQATRCSSEAAVIAALADRSHYIDSLGPVICELRDLPRDAASSMIDALKEIVATGGAVDATDPTTAPGDIAGSMDDLMASC